jgi:flagellar protein FliS
MFASSSFSRQSGFGSGATAYRQVGVQTGVSQATPHQLVAMLYDGLVDNIVEARGALRSNDVELKGQAIGRACRIVEEGLKACLDMNAGGALAVDLRDLYTYMTLLLTKANRFNEESHLDEVQKLIEPVRSAWASIAGQVATNGGN